MLHDLTYLGADISTNDMTIPPQASLTNSPYPGEHQSTPYQPASLLTPPFKADQMSDQKSNVSITR